MDKFSWNLFVTIVVVVVVVVSAARSDDDCQSNRLVVYKVIFRCQFHQHFTSSFFVRKSFEQLFCTYGLGLYFFGARILAQKLFVKCW